MKEDGDRICEWDVGWQSEGLVGEGMVWSAGGMRCGSKWGDGRSENDRGGR